MILFKKKKLKVKILYKRNENKKQFKNKNKNKLKKKTNKSFQLLITIITLRKARPNKLNNIRRSQANIIFLKRLITSFPRYTTTKYTPQQNHILLIQLCFFLSLFLRPAAIQAY